MEGKIDRVEDRDKNPHVSLVILDEKTRLEAYEILDYGQREGRYHYSRFDFQSRKTAIVAKSSGKVVGVLLHRRSRSGKRGHRMSVDIICVHPSFRLKGVAKSLVKELYSIAVKEGCEFIDALVSADNWPSMAVMKNSGFCMPLVRLSRAVDENQHEDNWWEK